MDKIPYSKGLPGEFKYYFYKNLSSVDLRDFFLENNISKTYYFLSELGNMTLFSTGYFSLSENDIKNLEDLSGLNRNQHYCRKTSKLSFSGEIIFIIFGAFMFIGGQICSYFAKYDNYKYLIIFQSILLIFLVVLIFIYTFEIIYNNKIFKFSENIPWYLIDDIDAMKETNAYKIIWVVLGIFVFNILFFFLNCYRIKEERNEFNISQKKIQEEALNSNNTDNIPEDFKVLKESGIDIELYNKT